MLIKQWIFGLQLHLNIVCSPFLHEVSDRKRVAHARRLYFFISDQKGVHINKCFKEKKKSAIAKNKCLACATNAVYDSWKHELKDDVH